IRDLIVTGVQTCALPICSRLREAQDAARQQPELLLDGPVEARSSRHAGGAARAGGSAPRYDAGDGVRALEKRQARIEACPGCPRSEERRVGEERGSRGWA